MCEQRNEILGYETQTQIQIAVTFLIVNSVNVI